MALTDVFIDKDGQTAVFYYVGDVFLSSLALLAPKKRC
jgi:hypothetical protein